MGEESSVTELIRRAERGEVEAADRLFTATYAELRRLARARLCAGGRNTLLDTSSLVHESYLRFARAGRAAGPYPLHALGRQVVTSLERLLNTGPS